MPVPDIVTANDAIVFRSQAIKQQTDPQTTNTTTSTIFFVHKPICIDDIFWFECSCFYFRFYFSFELTHKGMCVQNQVYMS